MQMQHPLAETVQRLSQASILTRGEITEEINVEGEEVWFGFVFPLLCFCFPAPDFEDFSPRPVGTIALVCGDTAGPGRGRSIAMTEPGTRGRGRLVSRARAPMTQAFHQT